MKQLIQKLAAAVLSASLAFASTGITAYASSPILNYKKPFIGSGPETSASKLTDDARKGKVDDSGSIVTGSKTGYSSWQQDENGWKLRYADGSCAVLCWESIDGSWFYFKEDGYAADGWILDPAYDGWFYIDIQDGMKTGWQMIDGKWYYFYTDSDGIQGKMAENTRLNGYEIDENGVWTGRIF